MSMTDSQAYTSLEEADDFTTEAWPDNEDIEVESMLADEFESDYAGEGIAIENYSDDECHQEAADFGELDTYHQPRRAHPSGKAGSALAAAIASTAEQEYRRWRPSGGKSLTETDPAATPILQEYYRTGAGMNIAASQLQSTGFQKNHPWSAVFISYVMKKAGAGSAFAYSPAHQNYMRAARRNRLTANTGNPFWAFRVTEIAPQVGDLVCMARDNSGATYDNIADRQPRKTHCDIVTAVSPGEIRVIGGNVRQNVDAKILRTQPDGRLRVDGKQSGYFAVVRCNDAAMPVPPPPQPPPRPAPGPSPQVRAGQHVVDRYALLRTHAGTPPDLVLKWNDMSQPTSVDVVVHLHGWSPGVGGRMNIVRHKLPASGLDFADPKNPANVGRTAPTLLILPRGHHDPVGAKTERYTFPALVTPGALQRLIDESLAEFAARTGVAARRGRLILTAHSGGGAALMRILGHTDPDEVHTFDALYTDPTPLIAWAKRRIASGSGALRVLYRAGEGTAAYSKRVAQALAGAGSRSFRVEPTGVSHGDIPPRFGWRLLADSSADLPGIGVTRESDDEYDFEVDGAALADETAGEQEHSVDEWSTIADEQVEQIMDEYIGAAEPAGEDEFDENDEDHAEEAAVHDVFADEADLIEEVEEDEVEDPELHAELMSIGFAAADESASLTETISDEAAFEEFGGAEHKHVGDTAAQGAKTAIMYGSPPRPLSFGDVVALAGDYFGDFYELKNVAKKPDGPTELAYARWHCLDLKGKVPMPAARPADEPVRKRVIDRYFMLASRNLTHFSAGGTALPAYMKAHADALVDALDAGQSRDQAIWQRALAKEAFADHYLTDMFAAGHVRTPRAAIKQWYETHMPDNTEAIVNYMARFIEQHVPGQRGVLPKAVWFGGWLLAKVRGTEVLADSIRKIGGEAIDAFALGDIVSLALHDYDNKGLDVVSAADARGRKVPGGYRWTAVGDGHLGVNANPGTRRPEAILTAEMTTAAVVASLRDLKRVRDVGVKLGNKKMSSPERAQAIRRGVDTPFAATLLIPREDPASHRNVPLTSSTSRPTPLDWRWGRLGPVAYRTVDEAVRVRIANEIKGMIDGIGDTVTERHLGVTVKVTGLKAALAAFVKHLQTYGIKAIEDAVGKPAR